jgi:hypothetical protein
MNKPTRADIDYAIELAEQGGWIDPIYVPIRWSCELYNPEGQYAGDGDGYTPGEAMAMAWLCAMAPDALIDAYVEPGSVPLDIPPGWRFELAPPWQSKRD